MFYCFIVLDWIEDVLQRSPSGLTAAATEAEVDAARKRMRTGRSPGIDGISADVFRKLNSVVPLITLLFSVMLRFAVYPQAFGIAIICACKGGSSRRALQDVMLSFVDCNSSLLKLMHPKLACDQTIEVNDVMYW